MCPLSYEGWKSALKKALVATEITKILGRTDLVPIEIRGDIVGLVKETTLLSVGSERDLAKPLSAYSITGGGTKDVDIEIPSKRVGVAILIKATYDAAATTGIRIEIYYSADGVSWDTDTDEKHLHPFAAGEARQKTYILASVPTYIRIRIVNLDATYAVTIDLWRVFI